MKRNSHLNRRQQLLIFSGVLVVLSWVVPLLSLVTMPLQYVYTHLHEAGHAIALLASGGQDVTIRVFANGSGVTTGMGGSVLLTCAAGYIGATAFGALLLALAHSDRGARQALLTLAWVLGIAIVFWVRGDLVGLITGGVGVFVFAIAGSYLKGDSRLFAAQFAGLYLGLASLQAVFSTLNIGQVAMGKNDAQILQDITGIPAILSAVVWTLISLALMGWALRRSWSS